MLREAEELDGKIQRNEEVGPLAGVFVGVKDNICTVDMPSTAGSRLLENYRPAYDATAVSKMRESGAIVVGKTNLDEFGMGSSTEASAYQVRILGILLVALQRFGLWLSIVLMLVVIGMLILLKVGSIWVCTNLTGCIVKFRTLVEYCVNVSCDCMIGKIGMRKIVHS